MNDYLIKDAFYRDVWCVLGLPFDAVNMDDAIKEVYLAVNNRKSCFISTPNLNFIIAAKTDQEFRESVILSEISIPDGMPIIWVARFLGFPFHKRVPGSGLFEELNKLRERTDRPINVFFFGGMKNVAKKACESLNLMVGSLRCVGHYFPGFGDIGKMSTENIINNINDSHADFLVVSLGAKKGQKWIVKNRKKLNTPIISHLGAVVNFVAGEIKRSPKWMQNYGLEWLWRIYKEPLLYRRYVRDGFIFIKVIILKIIPYKLFLLFAWLNLEKPDVKIEFVDKIDSIELIPNGIITFTRLKPLRDAFIEAASSKKNIELNLKDVKYMDASFIGLIMILYKFTIIHNCKLRIVSVTNKIKRIFYFNDALFLLE